MLLNAFRKLPNTARLSLLADAYELSTRARVTCLADGILPTCNQRSIEYSTKNLKLALTCCIPTESLSIRAGSSARNTFSVDSLDSGGKAGGRIFLERPPLLKRHLQLPHFQECYWRRRQFRKPLLRATHSPNLLGLTRVSKYPLQRNKLEVYCAMRSAEAQAGSHAEFIRECLKTCLLGTIPDNRQCPIGQLRKRFDSKVMAFAADQVTDRQQEFARLSPRCFRTGMGSCRWNNRRFTPFA